MRRHPLRLLIALLAPVLLSSCNNSSDGGDPMNLVAYCTSTLGGSGARVYAACGAASANMVSVDIFAAEVTDEVDAYNIVINFSPAVFHYAGFSPSDTLFGPTDCSGGGTVAVDNMNTNANSIGQVVYGVSCIGNNPTGVVPGTGPKPLGKLMFQAVSDSQTGLAFASSASAGCVGSASTGNALMTVSSSSGCLATIISGISFGQGSISLSALLQ